MLPDEKNMPERYKILRAMTPQKRLRIAHRIYWVARRDMAARVRELHPNWTKQQVNNEVSSNFLNASIKEC